MSGAKRRIFFPNKGCIQLLTNNNGQKAETRRGIGATTTGTEGDKSPNFWVEDHQGIGPPQLFGQLKLSVCVYSMRQRNIF